jgi:23S rRNA (cytosine1962-C5)-methyltransferase
MPTLPALRLKPQEERRLKAGHLWIYSNEVDVARTPLSAFQPGDLCVVENAQGRPFGLAYVNPASLISARLLSRRHQDVPGRRWFEQRLQQALSLREASFAEPCYRWVYGESDGLPGLVIDRFHDDVVVQVNTAGMERLSSVLLEAIDSVLSPRSVQWRNDSSMRTLEGLPEFVGMAKGELPEALQITENGVRFRASASEGQKTGWFYDHRENRAWLNRHVRGKRVLDLFSYLGGWGVQAAVHGASAVLAVDTSAPALEGLVVNATLNAVQERVSVLQGNALDIVSSLAAQGERFDVVICDPPAFIKRKKDFKAGLSAYRHANEQALRLVEPGGLLMSASCSMHLPMETLKDTVRAASRHVDRHLQQIFAGGQGPDHPVHPAIPETDYLKAVAWRVLPSL